jgi:hypothetical protein
MSKDGTGNTDVRRGAYDPVSEAGLPQAAQVKDNTTPQQKEQLGADVRAEPMPGTEPVLPEGLVRPPRDRSTHERDAGRQSDAEVFFSSGRRASCA